MGSTAVDDMELEVGKPVRSPSCICCNASKPNYKCPKCFLKYCSVTCCQNHKKNGTCPGRPTTTLQTVLAQMSNLTVSKTTLDPCENLVRLVNSSTLQQWIRRLYSCSAIDARPLFDAAMQTMEFVEFAQLISKIIPKDMDVPPRKRPKV